MKRLFVLFAAMAALVGMRSTFAATWFSEEYRLDELYNNAKSTAPNLGTQTEFGYMGYTSGSEDNDWICFTAGASGTLTISQASSSKTEVYAGDNYLGNPISTPYLTGTISVKKGVKYYFEINNYKSWQTGEYYYWLFSIGSATSASYPDLKPSTPSGWGSSLVVNTSSSSKSNASSFGTSDAIYVHFAGIVVDKAASSFVSKIYVDGSVKFTVSSDAMSAGTEFYTSSGCKIGTLSAGSHTIKVVLDDGNAITESNESNNTISKTIYVTEDQEEEESVQTYTVQFNYNDPNTSGRSATYNQTFTVGKYQNLALKDSEIGWSNPTGYSFAGWARTSDATTAEFSNGQRVINLATSGTVYLYAVWTAPAGTYLVKFYANDPTRAIKTGSLAPDFMQTFKVYATQAIAWKDSRMKISTPSGYRFLGWSESSSATTATYANGAKVFHLGDSGDVVTLYGVWQKVSTVQTYTVRFNKNDGSGTTATQTFKVGVAQCLKWKDSQLKWSRSGYRFIGWSSNGGNFYENGQSVKDIASAGQTVDLYALWISASKSSVGAVGDSAQSSTISDLQHSASTFTSGLYRGTFADGSGTFDLLVDEFDADGVATAYLVATTEDGISSEECEATAVGETLTLESSRGLVLFTREDDAWVAICR